MRPFSPPAIGTGSLFQRSFCQDFWEFLRFLVTGFLFSMFSASFLENALFRPFVFKMFSGSCFSLVCGHEVAMQSVGGEARKKCIINPFLLRAPGIEAQDRARISARLLPVPFTARASRE
jgi:hypothetical protein